MRKRKARVEELEEAIASINAHNINIAHHQACIENIIRGLYSAEDYQRMTNSPGKDGMYAEDIFEMLKSHFEKGG